MDSCFFAVSGSGARDSLPMRGGNAARVAGTPILEFACGQNLRHELLRLPQLIRTQTSVLKSRAENPPR